MSYDELHTAYHEQANELELVTQALASALSKASKPVEYELPQHERDPLLDYGNNKIINDNVNVNGYNYSIIQRDEFTFYVRNDIIRHVDIKKDSMMILTLHILFSRRWLLKAA